MANNNFDFDKYNELTKKAPTGLKLHLGIQLIQNVVQSLEYFDNPLEAEIRPIYMELKEFHKAYKAKAAENAKKRENESERNADIDNNTLPQPGVKDMMAMFQQFQQMLEMQKAANIHETPVEQPDSGTNG